MTAGNLLFHLDKSSRESLQSQLRRSILDAILNGSLPPGYKLPSTRKLSKDLQVSRNTVILVYQHLIDDGYLVSRERSGLYVNADIVKEIARSQSEAPGDSGSAPPAEGPDLSKRLHLAPSKLNYLALPENWRSIPFPFVYGQTDRALFPLTAWRECTRLALGSQDIADWIHDDKIYDDPYLIEQIKTRLLPARGIHVSEDEILITLGGQNALYMLAGLLVRAQTTVGIENPGYPDAQNIMRLFTERLRPIPVDEDGMVVDDRLAECDYVFATPSHQCPTTLTMPVSRRQALLDKAREHDFLIIEDDYESEINYLKSSSPALKAMDRENRVIYISSLSKILFPGLRIGYMVAPAELIRELKDFRRLVVRYTPSNNQRTTALFIAQGYYDSLIYNLRKRWHRRWMQVEEGLREFLPGCTYPNSSGGSSYWVKTPEGVSVEALVERAYERGVLIESGAPFFQETETPDRHFRLGFTSIRAVQISPGLRILGEVMDSLR